MAVKQGGLKRALASLLLICALLVLYLYWQQNHEFVPMASQQTRSDNSDDTKNAQSNGEYPASLIIENLRLTTSLADDNKLKESIILAQWTWTCRNNRCERKELPSGETPVPLDTCNMLCNSPPLWPLPTKTLKLGSKHLAFFHDQIKFETSSSAAVQELLTEAHRIFLENVARMRKGSVKDDQKSDCTVFIVRTYVPKFKGAEETVALRLDTDESYNLTLSFAENEVILATIHARSFFGARHGLETLSQLIWWDEYSQGSGMLRVLQNAVIEDAPKFAYRGLMLDTARNFFPLESLKRTLVGMAASKLNVFHWHISDSQSFPFDVPSVPQLAKYGAYGPDKIYSANDVREIVRFARVRGIRVMIEVDTPAHSGNGWTWGPQENLGQLAVCVNEQPWSVYCGEPPCGQLNPENPNVYPILEKIYKDILDLTGEKELFHIGGDEVNLECWAQSRRSTQNYNYTDYHMIWGEFTEKAIERLKSANNGKALRNVILWSSNLSKQPYIQQFLKKDEVVIQSWGASQWPETPDLLNDGYRIIVSHVDYWYLDCGFGKWRETGDAACDPYRTWQTFYMHRPWTMGTHNSRVNVEKQILGGEVCLWTEQVGESSLDARVWPRTAAFAERLWSDPHNGGGQEYSMSEDVYTRLSSHRARLKDRGISPEAMWPDWCNLNPGMCL